MEGNGGGLADVLFWYLPLGAAQNLVSLRLAFVLAEIRRRPMPIQD